MGPGGVYSIPTGEGGDGVTARASGVFSSSVWRCTDATVFVLTKDDIVIRVAGVRGFSFFFTVNTEGAGGGAGVVRVAPGAASFFTTTGLVGVRNIGGVVVLVGLLVYFVWGALLVWVVFTVVGANGSVHSVDARGRAGVSTGPSVPLYRTTLEGFLLGTDSRTWEVGSPPAE